MSKPTCYVTGATSDIGQSIIKKLCLRKYKIVVLVRDVNRAKNIFKNNRIIYQKFNLNKPLGKFYVDSESMLIHCAWKNPKDVNSPQHVKSVLTHHYPFIKKMVKRGVSKVFVIGTCSEFGMIYGPVKSNDETNPCTFYGMGKDYLHTSLRFLESDYNFELIWLRVFNIYGEPKEKNTVTSLFNKAINENLSEFPMSLGEQKFDYLLDNEVAEKIIKSLDKRSGVYHICSAKPIMLKTLLQKIRKQRNSNIKLKFGCYPYRDYEPLGIWGAKDDIKI